MNIPAWRRVALVASASVILAGVLTTSSAEEAHASPQDAELKLSVFPVGTSRVNFWDSWGARRSGGRRHQGIDIMSVRGEPALAVADGTVVAMDYHPMSGYFIRIDHGSGWTSTYMHLNNDTLGTDDGAGGTWTAFYPTLTVGAKVAAGDVIGYVGDSGNAEGTAPHIHFELKHDRAKTNPYPFLRDVWNREHRVPQPSLNPS